MPSVTAPDRDPEPSPPLRLSRSAWVNLVSNGVALLAVLFVLQGGRVPMPFSYVAHKLMHITGVILFVGNVSVGPLWLMGAYFRRDAATLRYLLAVLSLADLVFTVPGVQLTLWNGLALAGAFGGVRGQPWLGQSLVLLLSLILLGPTVVLYYQEKLIQLSAKEKIDDQFRRVFYLWSFWGMLLFVPIALIMYLMIAKQPLW